MKSSRKKGYFVAFEGGEGSGKSTQMRHLAHWLKKNRYPYLLTLNPGGTRIGEKIRNLLLDPLNKRLSPKAELLLYEADRAQHVEEIIAPALEKGKVIICDRFVDSSTVYQGICRGLGEAWVEQLNDFATGRRNPDLVFVLDLPESEGRKRIRKRLKEDLHLSGIGRRVKLDRLEREKAAFHRKVRKGFLKLAKKHPRRFQILDASKPEKEISALIQKAVELRLQRRWIKK